ncbi:PQQ-dependent sugar dehydrogenase [Stieleria sp. TO1_6]|uniref:family 16 glycoside hydrolase n=1 Tax=Stieleria tagensis TaxID=2956795 RepID=UPI00209AE9CD|nr:family 16 glycoside hydrolase [Stieleria tagensis]MCO8121551.1 PQQ-dependent sugar dehydrogenase [Stieleria tagensis]
MNLLKCPGGFSAAFALICMINVSGVAPAESDANQLSEAEKRGGWEFLFDGQSTDSWRNYKKDSVSEGWKIIDGALVRAEKGAGDLITKQKYKSFELLLDYKISPEGNSGLMFHVTEDNPKPWNSGPEIQIQDNADGHDPQKSGWLYQLYKPSAPKWSKNKAEVDATRPAGQWNQIYLRVTPDSGEVCVNGVRYYQFDLGSKDWKKRVADSKFAAYSGFGAAGEGHLCLQDHGNEVAFRNIRIRRINDDGTAPQPIDGKLGLKGELAFPNLKWDQWEPIDENGNLRELRLIELTHADDDSNRLFAASQYGAIWSFKNDPETSQSHLFLDLRDKVYDWKKPGANEQGLLGLAMHPQFKSNGKFYVYYSKAGASKSIISQFTVSADDPNKADPESELVLMEIDQPYQNHNGGSIEFGPDGFLYIGLGDGGDRNDPLANGQNLSTLLGSILRIDVDHPAEGLNYGIPSDNPFVDTQGARPEIYAHGVRNPWRIAFDSQTGQLWIGDVGQELWEEVNLITKGGNYGWSDREGMNNFGNRPAVEGVGKAIDPVWQYDHRVGRSITGGRVYRSDKLAELAGKYLYADYVTGVVWALTVDPNSNQATRNEQVFPDSVPVLGFGEDNQGEVYYLTNSPRGECIYRFAK